MHRFIHPLPLFCSCPCSVSTQLSNLHPAQLSPVLTRTFLYVIKWQEMWDGKCDTKLCQGEHTVYLSGVFTRIFFQVFPTNPQFQRRVRMCTVLYA